MSRRDYTQYDFVAGSDYAERINPNGLREKVATFYTREADEYAARFVYSATLAADLAEARGIIQALVDNIDRGDLILTWSAAFVCEYGVSADGGNQDRARSFLARVKGAV